MGSRSGLALSDRPLRRGHLPKAVIEIADGGVQARADCSRCSAHDPCHRARSHSEPVSQSGWRMPEGDQRLQTPPGTGGVPSRGHLFHHRRGDGEQSLCCRSADPCRQSPSCPPPVPHALHSVEKPVNGHRTDTGRGGDRFIADRGCAQAPHMSAHGGSIGPRFPPAVRDLPGPPVQVLAVRPQNHWRRCAAYATAPASRSSLTPIHTRKATR
jgi:hypothetical protein